jgi:hypothetical protein
MRIGQDEPILFSRNGPAEADLDSAKGFGKAMGPSRTDALSDLPREQSGIETHFVSGHGHEAMTSTEYDILKGIQDALVSAEAEIAQLKAIPWNGVPGGNRPLVLKQLAAERELELGAMIDYDRLCRVVWRH